MADFGKSVKKGLIDRDWTMTDLAKSVSEKTGLYCDQSYISKILAEKRSAPKIIKAIREILELSE